MCLNHFLDLDCNVDHEEWLSHLQLNQESLDELDQCMFQIRFRYLDLDCNEGHEEFLKKNHQLMNLD